MRVRLPGDVLELRYVDRSELRPDPAGAGSRRHLTLDEPVASAPNVFEVVTATLSIVDHDPSFPRAETLDGIGLRSDHPRWLARVLAEESELFWPDAGWAGGAVAVVDPLLAPVVLVGEQDAPHMTGGVDRWQHVLPEDFWDPGWVPGDEVPGAGVHCLAENDEIGLLVVPDLYEPVPLAPVVDVRDPPSLAGPSFEPCVTVSAAEPPPAPRPPGLDRSRLDPSVPDDLERIVVNQQALVAFADERRDLTVLLDVPLGLTAAADRCRGAARSTRRYAAAYHPWLDVATPDDARDGVDPDQPLGVRRRDHRRARAPARRAARAVQRARRRGGAASSDVVSRRGARRAASGRGQRVPARTRRGPAHRRPDAGPLRPSCASSAWPG